MLSSPNSKIEFVYKSSKCKRNWKHGIVVSQHGSDPFMPIKWPTEKKI